MKLASDLAFALIVFSILPFSSAHAYLDGASVSMVLQAAAGAVASALVLGKFYWSRLTGIFKRSNKDTSE